MTSKSSASRQKKPAPAKTEQTKPSLSYLRLKKPVNGLPAGRVVSAPGDIAQRHIEADRAEPATQDMISIAGGSIPHLHV